MKLWRSKLNFQIREKKKAPPKKADFLGNQHFPMKIKEQLLNE